jgi:drug/metabolite transporter (DMT)-like permease
MKPIFLVVSAMFCYGIANVLMEQKLSRYNSITLIVCYGAVILIMAVAVREFVKTDDASFSFPRGLDMLFVFVLGVVFFAADYFYVSAYTSGGNLYAIVCASMMFPVFASLMKLAWTGSAPNYWQIGGYVLAAGSILLITRGNGTS